jgi:hypothetical protein
MNHHHIVQAYRKRFPSSVHAQALLDEQVVRDGFFYWRGRTSDGTCLVTVLQSKAWVSCERYLETLMQLKGESIHNRCAHPDWEDIYAAAHSADVWRHFHDGISVLIEPFDRKC